MGGMGAMDSMGLMGAMAVMVCQYVTPGFSLPDLDGRLNATGMKPVVECRVYILHTMSI